MNGYVFLKRYFVAIAIALFLPPFGGALFLLVENTNKDIVFTMKERIGVNYHGALFDTLSVMEDYRGQWDIAANSGQNNAELFLLKK